MSRYRLDNMASQLTMFDTGPVLTAEPTPEEPPVFWPDTEDEPAPECERAAVTMDAAVLFHRWCRGARLRDAEMVALKASEFGK